MTYVVVSSGRLRGLQGWYGLGAGAELPPDRAAFLEKMRPVIADAQRKVDAMLAGDFSWMNVESTLLRSTRSIRSAARDILLQKKSRLALVLPSLEGALQDPERQLSEIAETMESLFGDFDQEIARVAAMQDITLATGAQIAFRKAVRAAFDAARTVVREGAKAAGEELAESPISTLLILGAVGAGLFLWMKSR